MAERNGRPADPGADANGTKPGPSPAPRRVWRTAAATLVALVAAGALVIWVQERQYRIDREAARAHAEEMLARRRALEAEQREARQALEAEAAKLLAAEAARQAASPPTAPAGPPCGQLGVPCPTPFTCTPQGHCELDSLVFVPGGPFQMGCNTSHDALCGADEFLYHTVTLSPFTIDRTEVTVEAYRACVDAGTCSLPSNTLGSRECNFGRPGREDHPMNCVNWQQARAYCLWKGQRLPTEAEWEKAARGIDGRRFPWGDAPPDCSRANIFTRLSSCVGSTRPVGGYPPGTSPFGVQDMIGNVLEWVADYYDKNYYYDSPAEDPQGPVSGELRVLRGSSFADVIRGSDHHVSARYNREPEVSSDLIGFRCAGPLPAAQKTTENSSE